MTVSEDENLEAENAARYRARILIKHPTIDPAVITNTLGVTPNVAWSAGSRTRAKTAVANTYPTSSWGYSLRIEGERNFSTGIAKLIDLLEPHASFLTRIVQEGGKIILIVHLPGDVNIGSVIEPRDLKRLADLSVGLGIEVFSEF